MDRDELIDWLNALFEQIPYTIIELDGRTKGDSEIILEAVRQLDRSAKAYPM